MPADVAGGTSKVRLIARSSAFLLATLVLLVPYLAALPFGRAIPNRIAVLWSRIGCRVCGLRLWVSGAPSRLDGLVFVANHVSYLDIPVLGGLADGTFVAKNEVSTWPLFGFLARLQRTVFVSRNPRKANDDIGKLRSRLDRGERLIVFPEGTSSDGRQVLPFKTSLFGAVLDRERNTDYWVQPVSITYPRYADGRPLILGLQDHYAWYGDMTLFDHLLGVFSRKGALVEVSFHPPVRAAAFDSRKHLAEHCEAIVADGVGKAHARRIYPAAAGDKQEWAALFRP